MPPYLTHFDIRHALIPGALMGGAKNDVLDLSRASWMMFARRAPTKNAPARDVALPFDAICIM
jgi:hypothetical protein